MLPKLSLILGGAASGKSAYAEGLFKAHSGPRVYLATAQSFDTEMENKIERHKKMRGDGWKTIERPLDIAPVFQNAERGEAILLDCATLWLSNLLLSEAATENAIDGLLSSLSASTVPIVIVSNEVGSGIVPSHALSRTFREEQGRLNQRLAAISDYVALIVAGLPIVLKGDAPRLN